MPSFYESDYGRELTGRSDKHLIVVDQQRVHRSIYAALNEMAFSAACDGHRLTVVSGWRSYARQCAIWNAKAKGERAILDDNGDSIPREDLTDEEAMWAILRWSALPGASRHHWGTDIDVIDGAALKPGFSCQLTRSETEAGGIFERFHCWLDSYLEPRNSLFFRPYSREDWGIAPEPWHLSFAPIAMKYQQSLSLARLREFILRSDILLQDCVVANLEEIYARFVMVDWNLYPQRAEGALC